MTEMKAILYARVSTDEQAKSGYSLPEQLRTLSEYAARQGWEVAEAIEDAGEQREYPKERGLI